MKLIIVIIITTFSFFKLNATELNLNGLKIDIPNNTSYTSKFKELDVYEVNLYNFTTDTSKIIEAIENRKEIGFTENDNTLLLAKERYFKSIELMIQDLKDGDKYFSRAMQRVNFCKYERTKKKAMQCALKELGFDYFIQISYPSSSPNFDWDGLKEYSDKDLKKEFKKWHKEFNDMNLVKVKKMDLTMGLMKDDVVFIEGVSVSSALGVKILTEFFLKFKDNKILSGTYSCENIKTKECLEGKQVYNNLKNQFIPNNEILVVANPKKKEEFINFFNAAKTSYRTYKMAKYLLLLL